MDIAQLPLFPLKTVLFPGGQLTLRIFETRYLALVRECSLAGHGFGVCLILEGEEVGTPALFTAIGCEARITDFATTADGLLQLSVQGERRFRADTFWVRDDGLVSAQVTWLEQPARQLVRPEHQLLALLLRRMTERAGSPHDQFDSARLDDADWLGWRLGEWLPISAPERQSLLQESDPHVRLQRLLELIPDLPGS